MTDRASVLIRPGDDLEIEATMTSAVFLNCETAYLQVASNRGLRTEFGVRIERGRVIDVYLWDGFLRVRHALSPQTVEVRSTAVVSRLPWRLVSPTYEYPELRASLVVNGGLVLSGVPVRIGALSLTKSAVTV